MAHTHTRLYYHLVFSTKHREPFLDSSELQLRLHPYLGGIVRELGGSAILVNGVADHVHLLTLLPATIAVADAVRDIKANSSGWVHEQWPKRQAFAWQIGYGAFTVSRSNVESVEQYISRQQEHHRDRRFEDEYLQLLKRHEVEFDERFLFD